MPHDALPPHSSRPHGRRPESVPRKGAAPARGLARRSLLLGGLALGGLSSGVVRAAEVCGLTPASSAGPYYPGESALQAASDLTLGADGVRAGGLRVVVQGRVMDGACQPLAGAVVELWQADPHGVYDHPNARGGALLPGFRYSARVRSDAEGRYRFVTLRPGRYPGRTPHLHFRVRGADGRVLTTQMYFADEAGNARDWLWRNTPDPARVTIAPRALAPLQGHPAQQADFDLVLA